jgi:hypothetical protein
MTTDQTMKALRIGASTIGVALAVAAQAQPVPPARAGAAAAPTGTVPLAGKSGAMPTWCEEDCKPGSNDARRPAKPKAAPAVPLDLRNVVPGTPQIGPGSSPVAAPKQPHGPLARP